MFICPFWNKEPLRLKSNNITFGQFKNVKTEWLQTCGYPEKGEIRTCLGGTTLRCEGDTNSVGCPLLLIE